MILSVLPRRRNDEKDEIVPLAPLLVGRAPLDADAGCDAR